MKRKICLRLRRCCVLAASYVQFAHFRSFARTSAEIVEFRSAYFSWADHFDVCNARAVEQEYPIHARTIRVAVNGESLRESRSFLGYNCASKCLETLFVAFNNSHVYANGVADVKFRDILFKVCFFNLFNEW